MGRPPEASRTAAREERVRRFMRAVYGGSRKRALRENAGIVETSVTTGDDGSPASVRLRVGCELRLASDGEVPVVMLVRARPNGEHRTVYESHWSKPKAPIREYVDGFGNFCWRLTSPPGVPFTVRYDAIVETVREPDVVKPGVALTPVQDLPDETLVFTLPSRFVQSDLLMDEAWSLFGQTAPTWE